MLIIFQSGAFGGLLPHHAAMSLDQAKSVLRHRDSGEGEGSRLSKRFKGKAPVRVESDNESEYAGGDREDAGLFLKKSQPPVALGVCLRCSKRIDQVSEHTLRNKTVPVGHRCN